MFIGCNTLSFTVNGESDEEAIKLLAKAGFNCIDLNLNRYSVRDPVNPFWNMTVVQQEKYAASIKKTAREAQVYISQVHAPYPTYFPLKRKRKEVKEYIENAIYIAALIGSPYVVVHPLVPPEAKTADEIKEAVEMSIDFYREFFSLLVQTGVKLAVENMFNWDRENDCPLPTVASTVECMRYIIDTLNHMVGEDAYVACLDTGHCMLSGGGDLPYMVQKLAHRLRLLHIHDNDGKRDKHQAPYKGIINWEEFAKSLVEINYNGVLSLEVKTDSSDLDTAKRLFMSAETLRLTVEREKKNELRSKKTKRA